MASKQCIACGYDNLLEARFCAMCGSPLSKPVSRRTSEKKSATHHGAVTLNARFAGFWVRLVAMIIDILIVIALYLLLRYIPSLNSTPVALFFIIFILYFLLPTSLNGQTPGKMIIGIRVVNKAGNKPGLVYIAIREVFGKITSVILISAGFFWIGWDDNKQGLHDKIAGTYVVMA